MTKRSGRDTRMYIEDNPNLKVHPIDCVPSKRSKSSWTGGVEAFQKRTSTTEDNLVGWFYPPRLRNKRHHNRFGPNPKINRLASLIEEEE